MSKRDKSASSPEKPVEKPDKKYVGELTNKELDKISGGPISPPNSPYIGGIWKN
jgi:bacteriocin-like protein